MRHRIVVAAAIAALVLSMRPALAAEPGPSISVSGTGSIQYSPDIAHISLGVRGESTSAASAARSVNTRAQAVIDALRKLGIADSDIATSNYSIEYQSPPQPDGGPVPMSAIRRPSSGTYVATEAIDVKTSLLKAGAVLDTAVSAGANETYGLTFDTSERQALYRRALARAVADARAQAEILAQAAGVHIAGVQSLTAGGGGPVPVERGVMMATVGPAPPVMGGTGTIDASVSVVYKIR